MKKIFYIQNISLVISVLIVVPVALIYGFQPKLLFDIHPKTTDENNILKAVMGFYLAFSGLWILGILKPSFWKAATISNLLFMFGLAFGRMISIFFDGIPSTLFILGTIGEVILGIYALLQYRKFNDSL
jgi:hypothetical protein